MPTSDGNTIEIGNRESKITGGLNNTLTWKNWTFNMLWEFRIGGDVFNGTKYSMTNAGVSKFSGEIRDHLVIAGVQNVGTASAPVYQDCSYEWYADKNYEYNGKVMSGYNIIKNYYTTQYLLETSNYMTDVNSLRLRSVSLSYDMPRSLLAKTKVIKRAMFTATATNLLLFTNYDGDPEVAAAGAGRGGSSSVGFDYFGVPATSSFSFGVNLTF